MPLFLTFQTNKPFVLVPLKIFKYHVKLITFGLVFYPSLWNIQINKWVYFDENLHWYFIWIVIYFLPNLEQNLS